MMTKLSFHHLLDANQIKDNDIKKLIALAEKYRKTNRKKTFTDGDCNGLIAATLFFEPSTRTRMSFESAMIRLGGQVISLENGQTSSVKKGETLSDTGRIVSNYADIVIMRHPQVGSVAEFAKHATIPVINAGDGENQHPTQSLVDVYAIFCEKKKLDNLKIGIVGDLKYSRAVRSLLALMSNYRNNHFALISHPSLKISTQQKKILTKRGCKITETSDLESAIKDLDILYATRVQQERFSDKKEYEKVKNFYRIDKNLLSFAKKNLTIFPPLPRLNEIDEEVDSTSHAKYFTQANYAIYMRMALLASLCKQKTS